MGSGHRTGRRCLTDSSVRWSAVPENCCTPNNLTVPIWSNNPIERLNKEIKRRANVVEIFPNPGAFLWLATAVVIEAHDEWQVTRRYVSDVSMDELRVAISTKQRAAAATDRTVESLTPQLESA
ncbi:transposase [Rhodococcus erythropolis]|uniref:transposase n=1 Tax=Rhodococcus erythropolis TaxID=1833 RepID=UPI00294A7226|nr:transposase [Rhodococcus erythropolis]MDV6278654.1 transposase [Rhodococcus erythropolis]